MMRIAMRIATRIATRVAVHVAARVAVRVAMRVAVRTMTRTGAHSHSQGRAMIELPVAPKKSTNLSLNSKVLEAARDLGLNLSETVDTLLAQEVRRLSVARWAADNRETVAAYNRRVDERGLWNADLRKLSGQI